MEDQEDAAPDALMLAGRCPLKARDVVFVSMQPGLLGGAEP